MDNLVVLNKEVPVTDTLVIAKGLSRQHKNTISLVRDYESSFKKLGKIAFETRKSKRGKPTTVAILNEGQVYFLFTLFSNSETVVNFKVRLVQDFIRMKTVLSNLQIERNKEEWIETRSQGKLTRKETTATIQEFVKYATIQGSQNAVRYYSNITKMENKALFILEQKYPNVREMLTHHQLSTIKIADRVIVEALEDGMIDNMNYKDIYKLAKERVETLATLIKPTMVINYNEVKVIEG